MTGVPARVAAEAEAAMSELAALAAAAATPPAPLEPTNPEPAPAPAPAEQPPAPQPSTVVPIDGAAVMQQLAQLQQTNATLAGRLEAESQVRLAAERRAADAARTPPAPPAPAPLPVSDTERNEFGAETIDLITKMATHLAAEAVKPLSTRIAQLEGRVGNVAQVAARSEEVAQETAFERYKSTVAGSVPDWETINVSDKFMNWLQTVDKASNTPYLELLQAAHAKGNAGSVIHIFNLYKLENGLIAAATPPATTPAGHIDPASLAAPSTTAPAPPPSGQPPVGRIWTMAEVDKLYEDYNRKRITKATFEAQEAEYNQALREGRVVTK